MEWSADRLALLAPASLALRPTPTTRVRRTPRLPAMQRVAPAGKRAMACAADRIARTSTAVMRDIAMTSR
jgi:hypothetical protein